MTSSPASIETLKQLTRTFPDTSDMYAMIRLLTAPGAERALAITVSALLERALEACITSALKWPSEEEANKEVKVLFFGDGPLSSFSSKIKIGYALGLYGKIVRDDLDTVREVRNAFAHSTAHIDFRTPAVAVVCDRLKLFESIMPDEVTPRPLLAAARFTVISQALTGLFLQAAHDPELRAKLPLFGTTWKLTTGFPKLD
jgi:DNA-binding MltR family transcriptional regulator